MLRHLLTFAAVVALAGCQNYKFNKISSQPVAIVNQQVNIGAKLSPPSIMIVQDLSGSMCEPIQLTAPGSGQSCLAATGDSSCTSGYCSSCSPGCGTCTDATDCNSKLALVSKAMPQILSGLDATTGEFSIGLTAFGGAGDTGCTVGTIKVNVGDAVTTIPAINSFYGTVTPSGGTPTGATLQVAATDPAMTSTDPSARKFIILVTDGLPNCSNDAEATACVTAPWPDGTAYGCASPDLVPQFDGKQQVPPANCVCSFGSCVSATPGASDCCPLPAGAGALEPDYCLDDQGTESVIASLYANQNITTYVVGLGYDYASNPTILNAMAAAGHGSSTAFQASNPAALQTTLTNLIKTVTGSCVYLLDQPPVNAGLITVTLNGVELPANPPTGTSGYTFTPPQTITITDPACATIESGGTAEDLEITAVAQ